MRLLGLKSVCRRKHRKYIRTTPGVTAENILNRKFYADKTNEKWLLDCQTVWGMRGGGSMKS